MPPHEGDHDDGDDEDAELEALGLPVRRRLIRPGALATGCAIAAAFAVAAQFRAVFAGLVGGARAVLVDDPRVRSLASAGRAFGEAFPAPGHPGATYRPLLHATLAVDWFLSRSEPGAPAAWWFHAVDLLLHAANAALVYLLFVNLTKRKLGAPLIAAVLFAVHPLAVETTTSVLGRAELLGALCGLLSAVLFIRSAGNRRLVPWAVGVWGIGLFACASLATMPAVAAAGLVAYHEVEPKRLLSARLRNRFLWFAAPAGLWLGARAFAFGGSPFPMENGSTGSPLSFGDAVQAAGRAAFVATAQFVLPARLCGDCAADVASRAGAAPWDLSSALGLAILAVTAVLGVRLLRRRAAGFPLLAYSLALVPAVLAVAGGGVLADRLQYVPMAFLCLLVAEALEALYYRWGPLLGLAPTLALFAAFAVQSHLRAPAWQDEAAFRTDVARSYP